MKNKTANSKIITRERERSKISARWHSRWGITISSIIIYIIWAKTPLLNDQYNRYTVQTIWQYCFFFSCSFLPPFCLYFDTSLSTKDFHIHMIITYRKNTWRKEKNTPNIPSTQQLLRKTQSCSHLRQRTFGAAIYFLHMRCRHIDCISQWAVGSSVESVN